MTLYHSASIPQVNVVSASLCYVSLLISDDRMDSCEERSIDETVLDDGAALLDTDAQDHGPGPDLAPSFRRW